jgi:hypothetical protein
VVAYGGFNVGATRRHRQVVGKFNDEVGHGQ